jgi:hypothetical protein
MSAHDPQDQHHDAPVPPVRSQAAAGTPGAPRDATPSVRDLLAACAAARTVSTPPADPPAADGSPAARPPSRGRDAA